MVVQAANDLPASRRQAFVLRSDMAGVAEIRAELERAFPAPVIREIERVTEGQACTAVLGVDALEAQGAIDGPLTIGACDNGALYDAGALQRLMDDAGVDVIVWAVRGYPNALRNPKMYGWIDADGDRIRSVSVKVPLADPKTDPVVLGTFTFRRAADFRRAVDRLIARDGRVNGEFYIDSCINDAIALGLDCRLFAVDHYLCWGTPNDLKTFEYWQSCFSQWAGHPYRLDRDHRVPAEAVAALEARYRAEPPSLPAPRP
jgi:hypothetical protein